MKIGIIIHSHTGNTLSVAEKLKEALVAAGHTVNLERVIAENEDPSAIKDIKLQNNPDVSGYDALIFGAPVRAFSLSPVMNFYLAQVSEMSGKTVSCYVTQQLKKAWMGGNRAIKQMKNSCTAKGGNVTKTGIVNWSSKNREQLIADVVTNLGKQ